MSYVVVLSLTTLSNSSRRSLQKDFQRSHENLDSVGCCTPYRAADTAEPGSRLLRAAFEALRHYATRFFNRIHFLRLAIPIYHVKLSMLAPVPGCWSETEGAAGIPKRIGPPISVVFEPCRATLDPLSCSTHDTWYLKVQ